MMKILFVSSSYVPVIGGLQINTHNLAKALSLKGIKVTVLTRCQGTTSGFTIDGIKVYHMPFYVFRGTLKSFFATIIRGIICLVKGLYLLLKIRPDVVNVHFLGANAFYVFLLRKIIQFKLVVTLHGGIEAPKEDLSDTEGYWEAKILNWTARTILRDADAIIVISRYLYNKVNQFFPDLSVKCSVIPVGIEHNNIKNVDIKQENFILALGRLSYEKGFDILIEAFGKICSSFSEIKLVLAGDGDEKKSLIELVNTLGLNDRIFFFGEATRTEAVDLLSKCRFLVVPSRNESFGVVMLEAMALRKAVVATTVGGIPELIKDHSTGFLVPPENPEELAQTIRLLLTNEKLAKDVGSIASKTLKSCYNWEFISDKYLKIYNGLVKS